MTLTQYMAQSIAELEPSQTLDECSRISPSGGRIRHDPRPHKRRAIPVKMCASAWTARALKWVTYDALMAVNAPGEAARLVASQMLDM